MEDLTQALEYANKAVELDQNYKTEDAIECYKKTIELLTDVSESISDEDQKHRVLNHKMIYHDRMKALGWQYSSSGLITTTTTKGFTFKKDLIQPKTETIMNDKFDKILKTIWIFKILKSSIQSGAYLTKHLYVPPEIWTQENAKLAGLSYKMSAFESVLDCLGKLQALPTPATPTETIVFQHTLDQVVLIFQELTSTLAKPFPFVINSTENTSHHQQQLMTRVSPQQSMGLGKFTNFAAGFGRMVKKQALTAVERVGTAGPTRILPHELDRYVHTLDELFKSSEFLAFWGHPESAMSKLKLQPSQRHQAIGHEIRQKKVLLSQYNKIVAFFKFVVCELILRDLELLFTRYLNKQAKSFGANLSRPIPTEEEEKPSIEVHT